MADLLGLRAGQSPLHGDWAINPVPHDETLAYHRLTGGLNENGFPGVGNRNIALKCRKGFDPRHPAGAMIDSMGSQDRHGLWRGCCMKYPAVIVCQLRHKLTMVYLFILG